MAVSEICTMYSISDMYTVYVWISDNDIPPKLCTRWNFIDSYMLLPNVQKHMWMPIELNLSVWPKFPVILYYRMKGTKKNSLEHHWNDVWGNKFPCSCSVQILLNLILSLLYNFLSLFFGNQSSHKQSTSYQNITTSDNDTR